MQRSWLRDKHWLLLSILTALLLVIGPAARGQADTEDQAPDQDQATPYIPNDDSHDSHARIVRISYVDGQVRIDHGSGYESASMNVPVTEHNWLQTRSDGWAEVQFEDGSLLRLAPDTVIAFTELSRLSSGGAVTTIDLDQGEAEFKVARREDSEFQITVKNKTIVLVQSGAFRVTSTNADPLEVVVWKGEVAVRDSESGGEVAVKKNETFVLDAMDVARYALDKGAEADDLDEWSKQRDDYLSTYASSHGRFQSPYQYGTGDLGYYGEYFDDPIYGTLWQPSGVNLGWDPFMNGYWIDSPGFGYTWISAYPWGWLPYRYGRWIYLNHRGWCWEPGGWNRWHTGPRWVNGTPGFRAPAPPANNRIVITGAPGGRVVRPANPGDRGGRGARNQAPGAGNSGAGMGRISGRDNDDRGGFNRNRRVLTNDDVQARVPRTDVPAQQPAPAPAPAPGTIDADRRPKAVDQQQEDGGGLRQREGDRFRGDRDAPRTPAANRPIEAPPPAERSRASNPAPPSQPVAPPVSQPTRQYTPPPVVRQSAPPPQPAPMQHAPMRQSAPPAESSARSDDSGSRSSRPK
jgi:uncharacterized protein DUF6600/FecR-like protein